MVSAVPRHLIAALTSLLRPALLTVSLSLILASAHADSRQEYLNDSLRNACWGGRIEEVTKVLARGAQINARSAYGSTALSIAIEERHTEIALFLIANGADPNAKDKSGKTLLMYSCDGSSLFETDNVFSLILNRVADLNQQDTMGLTALMYACNNPDAAKTLLERGANIHIADNKGWTALMHACDWHIYAGMPLGPSGRCVDLFLNHKAQVNHRDTTGKTALLIASSHWQDIKTVDALIGAGADPNIADNSGVTPLAWAAMIGQEKQITALRNAGAKINLSAAMLMPDAAAVKSLLDRRADVNQSGPNGRTPLMIAAERGDVDLCGRLLNLGARTGDKDEFGLTALHIAVGANGWGWDTQHSRAWASHGPPRTTSCIDRPELVKLLLAHGASIEAEENSRATPLMWAAHWNFAGDVRELVRGGARLKGESGISAVTDALRWKHTAVVRIMVESGASPDAIDDEGAPLLVLAAEMKDVEVVSVLLSHGANVDARDKSGNTALICAADPGQAEIVKLLLRAHANRKLEDYEDQTALYYARKAGRTEIVNLLQ